MELLPGRCGWIVGICGAFEWDFGELWAEGMDCGGFGGVLGEEVGVENCGGMEG